MSVYIKGMEMPTCCAECRFLDESGDYPWCIITDEQRGYNFRIRELRMPHCPLVPVPDHGRLIDADKLMDALPDDFSIPSTAAKVIEKTIIPTNKEDG